MKVQSLYITALVAFLFGLASCEDRVALPSLPSSLRPCSSSDDCPPHGMWTCAGPLGGPYGCLTLCAFETGCPSGTRCQSLTAADCPTCRVETMACWPDGAMTGLAISR